MTFHDPLLLLAAPAAVAAFLWGRRRAQRSAVTFSSKETAGPARLSVRVRLSRKLFILRVAALVLLAFALARPRAPVADSRVRSEGIDIVLALDSSTSMLAEDFKVGGKRRGRVEVVKGVVQEFIEGRKRDRIGIITFAARPYVVSPLTLDYGWLMTNLQRVRAGMLEDGTAIGSGLAAAVNRLRDTKAKSKVVILLTDGRNNAGSIAPMTAAEAARALGIKVYTIGAGSRGPVPYPVRDIFGRTGYQQVEVDIDEELLARIAEATGGKYFRATDTESLRKIYRDIDAMEKTPIDERGYEEYRELFPWFLIPAVLLILIELILADTAARRLP